MKTAILIESKTKIAETAKDFLLKILSIRLNGAALTWFERIQSDFQGISKERALYIAFSGASRYVPKEAIRLKIQEQEEAETILSNWNIAYWTQEQSMRTLLVLMLEVNNAEEFKRILTKLFSTAEVDELVALYAALPLFPFASHFADRASEGVRNNITPVFDAIALHNPYPAQYLSDEAWNQLILKAIFNNRPIHQIVGLENRSNKALTNMLCDFAHERWAAGRSFSPQLWRCAGSFLDASNQEDLQRALHSESLYEKLAAALACSQSKSPELHSLIDTRTIKEEITKGALTWQTLINAFEQ